MRFLIRMKRKKRVKMDNPVPAAMKMIKTEGIPMEVRPAATVVAEIMDIGKKMSNRWEKQQEFRRWVQDGRFEDAPMFVDEDSKETRSARYALSPCYLINTELSKLVNIVLKCYTAENLHSIKSLIESEDAIREAIERIRQIAIHSEEAMEEEAMDLIFKVVERNPSTYKNVVMKLAQEKYKSNSYEYISLSYAEKSLCGDQPSPLFSTTANHKPLDMGTVEYKTPTDFTSSSAKKDILSSVKHRRQQERIALLRTLVVDAPKHLQKALPSVYKGLVFKYFDNYVALVEGELALFNIPLRVESKSDRKEEACHKPKVLRQNNPAILDVFSMIRSHKTFKNEYQCSHSNPSKPGHDQSNADGLQFECIPKNCSCIVERFPELFGLVDLSSKTFTFVGAGFPLTGVILHILTGGARVNLVDCDENAVRNARKFLRMTEDLDITDADAILVVHANCEDVIFRPATTPKVGEETRGETNAAMHGDTQMAAPKVVVLTDILDLASAIPESVTHKVLKDNASEIEIVRKRNVRGMSQILYETFLLDTGSSSFRLAAEVTPPQKVLSGATPDWLVTGLLAPINVNSCQLYLNSKALDEKCTCLNDGDK